MIRFAALVFSFWAAGFFASALLACVVLISPDARTPVFLPLGLFGLALVCWRAGLSLWRPGPSTRRRLVQAAAATGPLFLLVVESLSASAQPIKAGIAVLIGWALFAAATLWLARRVDSKRANASAS
ncbi:MAG: hypothetical protein ACJ796_10065 [Gemmatimonadaceae bacterium]